MAGADRLKSCGEAKTRRPALLDDALLTTARTAPTIRRPRKPAAFFSGSEEDLRGEPHERVMVLLPRNFYWMDGEGQRPRLLSQRAVQDSDNENKEYAADFVLLDYLDGFATAKLSGDGSDAFKRAQELSKMDKPPQYDARANTVFFVEFGRGPVKYATGEYGEELRFREGRANVRAARIKLGEQTILAGRYDDLNFQAMTRGGRIMDHVLGNKAVFKSTTDTLGNVALIGGVVRRAIAGARRWARSDRSRSREQDRLAANRLPRTSVVDNLPQCEPPPSSCPPGPIPRRLNFSTQISSRSQA